MRGRFRATPLFAGAGGGPELSIVFGETRKGSGAGTLGDADRNDAVFPRRFRLRYSRIQAALCAGSR
jgi:hypothetical protein